MDNWFDDNFTKAFEPGNDRELNAQRSIEEDWRRVDIRDAKVRDDIAKTADSTRDTVDELKALREQVASLTKDLEIERQKREDKDNEIAENARKADRKNWAVALVGGIPGVIAILEFLFLLLTFFSQFFQ